MKLPRLLRLAMASAALTSTAAYGQALPERLGPTAVAGSPGPRVVTVQPAARVDGGAAGDPEPAALQAAPGSATALREAQRLVATARLEGALAQQQRILRLAQPNPETMQFHSSAVVPQTPSFRPLRMADPVELFQPSSSFSHVLRQAERNREDARLELAALEASEHDRSRADRLAATPARSQAAVETELALTAFRLRSAELRLAQLENMSQMTYSQVYANLGGKLRVEILQHQLAAQRLVEERDQLSQFQPAADAPLERTARQ